MQTKKGEIMSYFEPIKMNKDAVIITIPNDILISIWTLDKNINKKIIEMIPIALKHIEKINKKLEKQKKGVKNGNKI